MPEELKGPEAEGQSWDVLTTGGLARVIAQDSEEAMVKALELFTGHVVLWFFETKKSPLLKTLVDHSSYSRFKTNY